MATSMEKTDAAAVAEIATRAAQPRALTAGEVVTVVLPDGARLHVADGEYLLDNPRRKRERVSFFETDSLIAYINVHKVSGSTAVYADRAMNSIVAVINDSATGVAGWCDHVATLQFRHTVPWKHWTSRDTKLMGQLEFAEHIEQGLNEITKPPAADMLELAQNFDAHRKVSFRSVNYLHNGVRELVYEEALDAKAGQGGSIQIPREFELAVAPYEGVALQKVTARLRYRLHDGQLNIGYSLVRPDEVLEVTIRAEMEKVFKGTGLPVWIGNPPQFQPAQHLDYDPNAAGPLAYRR